MRKILYAASACVLVALTAKTLYSSEVKVAKTTQDISKPMIVSGKNSSVTVQLPANATTGYQWYLSDYNHSLIRPKSYTYTVNQHEKGMMGVGGLATFKLQVTKTFKRVPQSQTLTFTYARPWDMTDNAKTQTVTVLSSGE